ncbi:MAG: glycosyltransferase, partial [Candidatus Firestonebacteria bacterium]
MIKYTAVIVSYNCASLLKECIDSVLNQSFKPLELRIIDSASSDGSAELLKLEYSGLKLSLLKENAGFAKAVNEGINGAPGDYFLVLNSDVVLDRFFMENIAKRAIAETPQAGMFCGKLLKYYNNGLIDSEGQFLSPVLKPKERSYLKKDDYSLAYGPVFSACGAAVVYKKDMVLDVSEDGKLLDEDFFMYYDDLDLGW